MTEMRPTMVLGVVTGMSRTIPPHRARSHLRGLLDTTEAADMKRRMRTCVIVKMRGGVADMARIGEILVGHAETAVPTDGGALFASSPLHVRTSFVADKAYLAHWFV